MTSTNWTPTTRAYLVPGAVFVVRDAKPSSVDKWMPNGTRIVLASDDGSQMPSFKREDGEGGRWFVLLCDIERVHPPAPTIPVPRDVAREFVRTHMVNGMGSFSNLGVQAAREGLRAAPDPAPLPAMTAELLDVYEYYRAREIASDVPRNWWAVPIRNLLDAIERAGILTSVQPKPPGVTDVQATLPQEWWA